MISSKLFLPLAALTLGCSLSQAVGFNSGAAISSGFGLADGSDLAPGSLIKIGVFNLSDDLIVANISDYAFLNSNFVSIDTAFVGKGDPSGAGQSDLSNSGLFNSAVSGINTGNTGLNVSGKTLYYWVFDSADPLLATQQGVFTSSDWVIPAGDGSPVDLASLSTDIAGLTVDTLGAELTPGAKIIFGGFGPGTNDLGAGVNFTLAVTAAIPEPSSFAALAVLAVLGAVASRRRRSA